MLLLLPASYSLSPLLNGKKVHFSVSGGTKEEYLLGLHNISFFYRHRNINSRNKHIAKDCNTTLG